MSSGVGFTKPILLSMLSIARDVPSGNFRFSASSWLLWFFWLNASRMRCMFVVSFLGFPNFFTYIVIYGKPYIFKRLC